MDTTPALGEIEELEDVEASLDQRMLGVALILVGAILVGTGT